MHLLHREHMIGDWEQPNQKGDSQGHMQEFRIPNLTYHAQYYIRGTSTFSERLIGS